MTKPVVLLIMDGWGINPKKDGNAVFLGNTPNLDRLSATFPTSRLQASGEAVGIMEGQMGDSNVGHLNLGAGRIVYQDLVRLSKAVENGEFFRTPKSTADGPRTGKGQRTSSHGFGFTRRGSLPHQPPVCSAPDGKG